MAHLLPSKVFGLRLRETRKARGVSQTALAQAMTAAGRPFNKAAVLRVESGERGISLDEAISLAWVLNAVPANLLTPTTGDYLALTDKFSIEGDELRSWLVTGSVVFGWPRHPPGSPEDRLRLDARLEQVLVAYARALVDAARAGDRAGTGMIVRAIGEAVVEHERAVAGGESDG